MGYQVYRVGKRWGGYGVPTYCEQPGCNEEIDRGMSFACGGEPFSEHGCDRYFCEKHLCPTCVHKVFKEDGHDCEKNEEECEYKQLCQRCAVGKAPFDYKPEHPDWIKHLLKDKSWATWRKNNPATVKEFRTLLTSQKEHES